MKFVIGGHAQGKLETVIESLGEESYVIWETPEDRREPAGNERLIVNQLQQWIRTWMEEGKNPESELEQLLEACPDCICIGDEIGNGIVPLDPFEREYREQTGRMYIRLAKRAEEVERVICGIREKLK